FSSITTETASSTAQLIVTGSPLSACEGKTANSWIFGSGTTSATAVRTTSPAALDTVNLNSVVSVRKKSRLPSSNGGSKIPTRPSVSVTSVTRSAFSIPDQKTVTFAGRSCWLCTSGVTKNSASDGRPRTSPVTVASTSSPLPPAARSKNLPSLPIGRRVLPSPTR